MPRAMKTKRWFTERQLNQLEQQMLDEYARIMRVARNASEEIFARAEPGRVAGDATDVSNDLELRAANS